MKKQQLKTNIDKILSMDKEPLIEFQRSFFQVEAKARKFLNKAFDFRIGQLTPTSANIEHGDFDVEGFAK